LCRRGSPRPGVGAARLHDLVNQASK
jgi:hypothetical protein